MTNGGGGAFRIVRFRIDATTIATAIPNKYIVRIITAPNDTTPSTVRPEKKAAIINVYTGKRAEQLMNGAIIMVAMRSFRSSIVRVAMIPGTAQAKLLNSGTKA